jgi:hypothetical protein
MLEIFRAASCPYEFSRASVLLMKLKIIHSDVEKGESAHTPPPIAILVSDTSQKSVSFRLLTWNYTGKLETENYL